MPGMGQSVYPPSGAVMGRPIGVLADGPVHYKEGGCVIDWAAVPAVTANTTINASGQVVRVGESYIRFGQVLCRNTAAGPSFGKFIPYSAPLAGGQTIASGGTVAGVTTLTMSSAANVNPGDALLLDTGGQAETLVVQSVAGNVVTFTSPTTLAHANGVAFSKPDVGNQTLRRSECFISDHTHTSLEIGYDQLSSVFDRGSVFLARVASDVSGGVPRNPTRAQLEAAFPGIMWIVD